VTAEGFRAKNGSPYMCLVSIDLPNGQSMRGLHSNARHVAFCRWLEQTSVGAGVRDSLWLFYRAIGDPAFAWDDGTGGNSAAVFDLRLLGWMLRRERVSELAGRLLPWTWAGFALQVVTGTLLFAFGSG